MSSMDINKVEDEEENKTPDKKQIEAEEKEVMLKNESELIETAAAELKTDAEGPVKTALSGDITEQGREDDDGAIEKDTENEKTDESSSKPKRNHFQFLHACPFTQFLHHPQNENETGTGDRKKLALFNVKYPKMFQKKTKDAEAALASMETLEDKLDTPNDGMETVKLDEPDDGKVATKLPLKERIRQKKFIMDDIVVVVVAVLVLLAVIIGVAIGARAGPPAERPLRLGRYVTTVTSCGHVEGVLEEGVFNFYSIPYAVPPVGEKRFTYAQPLNDLSMCWNGTLEAHKPGPLCMQLLENSTVVGDEDCLTLDIVTPHVRYDSPLPVVVLIGANTLAGGISPAQPSALYARTKEVVFVRPNFRLGAFGFLALDVLSESRYPPTSGNYALSDLLVALRWINLNIKHFGGDNNSVTLLGHRAGATLTAALTTIKKAQDLYARTWLSSPSVIFPGVSDSLEQAQKNNEQFKVLSKCSDAECLRRLPASAILSATPDTWLGGATDTLPVAGEFKRSWLVLDGDLLRVHAYESWEAQKEAKEAGKEKMFKPMIFGTAQHSAHSERLRMMHLEWTPELVEELVNRSVIGEKNLTGAVWEHFPRTYLGLVELVSAVRTLCPLVSLARMRLGAALYMAAGAGAGGGAGGQRLAPVNADVEAILGTFDSEMPEQRRFMAAMQALFYYYVWHGRAAGAEAGLLQVAQDAGPLSLPACDLLISADLVPRYAHVD